MKIILRKDVDKLGEVDSVVNVSDGYGRNFLLPKGLAVIASKKELTAAEKRQAEKLAALEARRSEFEALAKELSELDIKIEADAGEEGKLFGSVTSMDIASAVQTQANIELDKRKINLAEPIKQLGNFEATIKFLADVSATLKINVERKAAEKQ